MEVKLALILPVSPVNKTESVPCRFIGTVCWQHLRAPCSLHLKAFQAPRIVFCHNNGLVVYPRGGLTLRHTKQLISFLSVTTVSFMIVFAQKNQLLNYHQNCPWKRKAKTYYSYYCWTTYVPTATHHSIWTQIYFLVLCICSLQTVVMDNVMNKQMHHKETLGFYCISSHMFYFIQS